MPVLSEAEKQMARELAKIKDKMQTYTNGLEQVSLFLANQDIGIS